VDPKVVNAAWMDFQLKSDSPLIDHGIVIQDVKQDYDGVSRPKGAGYDIGAFEFDNAGLSPPKNFRIP
jgi:hypothetical protein